MKANALLGAAAIFAAAALASHANSLNAQAPAQPAAPGPAQATTDSQPALLPDFATKGGIFIVAKQSFNNELIGTMGLKLGSCVVGDGTRIIVMRKQKKCAIAAGRHDAEALIPLDKALAGWKDAKEKLEKEQKSLDQSIASNEKKLAANRRSLDNLANSSSNNSSPSAQASFNKAKEARQKQLMDEQSDLKRQRSKLKKQQDDVEDLLPNLKKACNSYSSIMDAYTADKAKFAEMEPQLPKDAPKFEALMSIQKSVEKLKADSKPSL